ncbi:transcription factor GATA4/5/6 [Elysia marginata]|uniref:Transcription factor GATA4/5/6 n=1 Tax=Elysia marginata TaxID=1093978 RepID=A0AAV4K3Y9_9GAST|nr:transcription factor GATA4/5/6 [Elysia marginata]
MQSGGPAITDHHHHRLIPKSLLASKDVELFFDHLDRTSTSPVVDESICSYVPTENNRLDNDEDLKDGKGQRSPDQQSSLERSRDEKDINRFSSGEKENEGKVSPGRISSAEQSSFTERCLTNASWCGESPDANNYNTRNDCGSNSNLSGNTSPVSETSRQQGLHTTPISTSCDHHHRVLGDSQEHTLERGSDSGGSNFPNFEATFKETQHRPHPHHHHQQQEHQQVYNMYQGGIALTPSAAGAYGQDSLTNGYLHSGTSPVYVPSTRPMLPVQYMATPSQGSMATPPTSSSLWSATPAGDVSVYATQASSGAFSYSNGGGTGAGGSPSGGRGDSGYGAPLGRHAATGLGGYPVTAAAAAAAYMGAELSPWNTFNNMALQQGFRPTTGPGKWFRFDL